MKTAQRILLTSLALFNQHGEHNVTSVDIAMELDISPGNLYYHFKGKEIIISALFSMYQQQMRTLLNAQNNHHLSIEELFYYLYLLLEKNNLFCFLFRSSADLTDKYPEIAKPFRHLLKLQLTTIAKLLQQFENQGILQFTSQQGPQIADLIGLILTQSATYQQLRFGQRENQQQLYQSLAQLLTVVLPYLNIEQQVLTELQSAISQQNLTSLVDDDLFFNLKD